MLSAAAAGCGEATVAIGLADAGAPRGASVSALVGGAVAARPLSCLPGACGVEAVSCGTLRVGMAGIVPTVAPPMAATLGTLSDGGGALVVGEAPGEGPIPGDGALTLDAATDSSTGVAADSATEDNEASFMPNASRAALSLTHGPA